MKEIYWVMPNILAGRCGPALTSWEPAALREAGILGIVSLDDGEVNAEVLQGAGLDHLPAYLPMKLLLSETEREQFLTALPPIFDFIDEVRRRPGATMVHCHYGLDRTGAVLACYLVAREGFESASAIEHLRQQRPQAMLAPGYVEAVQLFGQHRHAGSSGRRRGKRH